MSYEVDSPCFWLKPFALVQNDIKLVLRLCLNFLYTNNTTANNKIKLKLKLNYIYFKQTTANINLLTSKHEGIPNKHFLFISGENVYVNAKK